MIAAAQWKETLGQLEANEQAKYIIGRHWKGAETAFGTLQETANWMQTVRKVTPFVTEGARELRRLLWEGSSEDIESFADLAYVFLETITILDCYSFTFT